MRIHPRTQRRIGHAYANRKVVLAGGNGLHHRRIQIELATRRAHNLRRIRSARTCPLEHIIRFQKVRIVCPLTRHPIVACFQHLPLGHDEVVDAGFRQVASGQDVQFAVGDKRRRISGVVGAVGENRVRGRVYRARFQCRITRVGAGAGWWHGGWRRYPASGQREQQRQ